MIFVYKIDNSIKINVYFYLLLLLENWDQEKVLIQLFYSSYNPFTHVDKIEDF